MLKKPTVCITTYKREKYLEFLLSKLQQQTYRGFAIIVCDNAASSNVYDIVKLHKDLNISYFKEARKGICYARNKCLIEFMKTDSDSLVWIDDDEFPADDSWLQELIDVQNKTGAQIVASDVLTKPVNETQQYLKKALYRKSMALKDGDILESFYTNNTLIIREIIDKVGLFDLAFNFSGSEDLDFAVRANKLGALVVYSQRAKVMEFHPMERSSFAWFFHRGIRMGQGVTHVNIKLFGIKKAFTDAFIRSYYEFIEMMTSQFISWVKWDKGSFLNAILRLGTIVGFISAFCGFSYEEYKENWLE